MQRHRHFVWALGYTLLAGPGLYITASVTYTQHILGYVLTRVFGCTRGPSHVSEGVGLTFMARSIVLLFVWVVVASAAYARPGLLKRVEPKRVAANILWRLALRTVRRKPLTEGMDVVVRPAGEGKGAGVFAARFIANGELIGRYEGIMRSNRTYQWAHAAGLTSGAYAFQLSSGSWVDGEDASRSSWTRYINHAYGSDANVAPYGRGRPFIYFESIRDIEEGEELLFDYGDQYDYEASGFSRGVVEDASSASADEIDTRCSRC